MVRQQKCLHLLGGNRHSLCFALHLSSFLSPHSQCLEGKQKLFSHSDTVPKYWYCQHVGSSCSSNITFKEINPEIIMILVLLSLQQKKVRIKALALILVYTVSGFEALFLLSSKQEKKMLCVSVCYEVISIHQCDMFSSRVCRASRKFSAATAKRRTRTSTGRLSSLLNS